MIRTCIKFFWQDEGISNDENNIPHCVSDTFIASLILLKEPSLAVESTKRKLLVEAYASLHTGGEFWYNFYTKVDSLLERGQLDEEDYTILRFNNEIKGFIGDQKIIDDIEELDDLKIYDYLKTFKDNLVKEKDIKIKEKVAQINSISEHAKVLESKFSTLKGEHDALKDEVKEYEKSDKILKGLTKLLVSVIILGIDVLLFSVAFIDIIFDEISIPNVYVKYFYQAIILIGATVFTAKGFGRSKIRVWLKERVESFLEKKFGL